jgi:hypothetical protein
MTDTSWHEYLHKLNQNSRYRWDSQPEADICYKLMQERYPGPYAMPWQQVNGKFEIYLHFNDPEEELMWKLRWS